MVKQSEEISKIQSNFLALLQKQESDTDLTEIRIFYNRNSLRLTSIGKKLYCKHYANYKFTIPKIMKTGQKIAIYKKMTFPYWHGKKQIILFTERDAFFCKLAGFEGWVNS